jgi:integrase
MEARMSRAVESENTTVGAVTAPRRRTLNFNDRSILALKPKAKLTDYWDPSLSGFGIRVAPSGRKTWIVMYRRPSGNASRMKLGTYPAVKLADARLAAQRTLGGIQIEHRDPVAEREADRKAETFDQLADEYMKRWAKQVRSDGRPRKRSWREDERQINLYLLPAWRNRKVKDITRRDVRDLVEGIAERRLRKGTTDDGQEKVGAPIMANRVLSLVKKMFNFALDREWIDANPAARLKPVSPETRRDRVLSPGEIRTLWRELDAEHHRIATMFRTQLLTAQRPGEVSRMRWAQLEPALLRNTDGVALPSKLEPVVWTIPGKETKNGLAHEVPLSGAVIELLRHLATRDEEERVKINTLYRAKKHQPAREVSEYVFPSRTRKGPIKEVQKAVQRLRKRCGFKFIAHDLRRTAATLMADAGVAENIISKVLNHVEPGVTRRHYNLHAYRSEKRAALETWARYLEAILANKQPTTGTVVAFRR